MKLFKAALLGLGVMAALPMISSPVLADAAAGENIFKKKCKACHTVGKNRTGPDLTGVVGAAAGHVEAFKYSSAMKESGLTWDDATLDAFLHKPKDLVKGTRMSFPGLKKEEDRAAVIEYLKTL